MAVALLKAGFNGAGIKKESLSVIHITNCPTQPAHHPAFIFTCLINVEYEMISSKTIVPVALPLPTQIL